MSLTIKEEKNYKRAIDDVRRAVIASIGGLEGKVVSEDASAGKIRAQFSKTIHGKVLGEKTELNITLKAFSEGETGIELEAFPLDAIGQKLMFGARKGVTRTVMEWFYAHMDKNLG